MCSFCAPPRRTNKNVHDRFCKVMDSLYRSEIWAWNPERTYGYCSTNVSVSLLNNFLFVLKQWSGLMTKRQFVNSKGETWEWEETPEVTKAVARLHETIRELEKKNAPDYGVGK